MTDRPASPSFTASDLTALRRLTALAPHPDGSGAVAVCERQDDDQVRYLSDLWWLPANASPATRLTRGDSRDRLPAWLADGTLLFASDRPHPSGPDAKTQVWVLPPQGEPYPLTDLPLGVSDFKVAGDRLFLLAPTLPGVALSDTRAHVADHKKRASSLLHYHAQPVRQWDHWITPEAPHLFTAVLAPDPADGTLSAAELIDLTPSATTALIETAWDVAADASLVALTWARMNPSDRILDKSIALLTVATGALRHLGAEPGLVHAAPRFTPSATALVAQRYHRTAAGYAQRALWRYDLATPDAPRNLTPTLDHWPAPWAVLPEGSDGAALVTFEAHGQGRLAMIDVATGALTALAPSQTGSWDFIAATPTAIWGVRSDLLHPPEAFVLPRAAGAAPPTPLARLSGLSADPDSLATRQSLSISVGSRSDGSSRNLHAWLVEPRGATNGRTLFWVHGGPVAAWGDQWHWRWSVLAMAALGYRVVLPNPAGSTGFGLAWVNDIWGNVWGERCFADLMALVDHLEAARGLRASDMAFMGGSFGGYMTNWVGGHTARFRLLVTHASLFDLSAFFGVTDMPSWWELMLGDHPWHADTTLNLYSPHRFVTHWQTPTLIVHGERDYRVPIGEGLALFEALQRQGVPSELAVFPDEHHWILKPHNVRAWYATVLDFLDRRWDAPSP